MCFGVFDDFPFRSFGSVSMRTCLHIFLRLHNFVFVYFCLLTCMFRDTHSGASTTATTSEQPPLWDYSRRAAEVLHWLQMLPLSDVLAYLWQCALSAMYVDYSFLPLEQTDTYIRTIQTPFLRCCAVFFAWGHTFTHTHFALAAAILSTDSRHYRGV